MKLNGNTSKRSAAARREAADFAAQERSAHRSGANRSAQSEAAARRAAAPKQASPVTAQMQKVLDYISEHGHITDEEVQSLLEIKKTRAFELMKQMRNMELINVVGRGSGKHYLIKQ